MELSNRLKAISEFVDSNSIIADIGTDHGYIPIYLAKMGKIKYAIACDINKGPLEKANKNIKQYKLENKIETRLSDGLEKLQEHEVDTIIIAGMGGMLISKILSDKVNVIKSTKKLILSPHSDVKQVRLKLHELSFKIINETMIKEDGKYYNIIIAMNGEEKKYNEIEYKFGKILIQQNLPLLKEYLQNKEMKYLNVVNSLDFQDTTNAVKRKSEIQKEIETIREVLKCL